MIPLDFRLHCLRLYRDYHTVSVALPTGVTARRIAKKQPVAAPKWRFEMQNQIFFARE